MSVIKTFFPKELPSQGVESEAARSFGENCPVESDVALEHKSVRLPFHLGGLAEMQRPRCVGRTVVVLSPGIAKIYSFGIDDGTVTFFWLVMNYSCVGSSG